MAKSTTNNSAKNTSSNRSQAAKKRAAERKAAAKKKQLRIARAKEIGIILFAGLCILLFVSCFTPSLSWLKDFSYKVFGILMYGMPFVLIALAVVLLFRDVTLKTLRKIIALLICLFALQGILSIAMTIPDGGLLGRANYGIFHDLLGSIGTYVVNVIVFAIGIVLFTDYSLTDFLSKAPEDVKASEKENVRKQKILEKEEAQRRKIRAEEEEKRLKIREEQRSLKRENAELQKTARAQESVDRLRNKNRELSRKVQDNEKRLKEQERFTKVYGIGDTKITADPPVEEEVETTIYRPDNQTSRYANSGSVPPSSENKTASDNLPEIHVPAHYFSDETEEDDDTHYVKTVLTSPEKEKGTEKAGASEQPVSEVSVDIDPRVEKDLTDENPGVTSETGNTAVQKLKSDPLEDLKTAAEIESSMIREPEKEYVIPPMRLLSRGTGNGISRRELQQELKDNADKLQQTLKTFGVDVTITNISCGPSVTRYEIQPAVGVKVSRIVSLTDDIKLNLAAADIRMEAPIPGKSAIGIEIPNKVKQSVVLRDLLETEDFKTAKSKLAFAAGRDIDGSTIIADIAKMPHVLVAGATGSGKSVCINSIIMSILYHASPTDVKMIMIDPKVVELSVYNGIPHLLLPVVTDPKKAASALNWAVAEMERRYQQFAEYSVRSYEGFNQMVDRDQPEDENGEPIQRMPQILIIVDELADLMMVAANDVETAIARLAQKARAAGLHLVLATQRPSVDVITGLIKANIPSRIAFAVSSGVDSRTILDMNGAEKLLGMGDMLYYPAGASKPVRVQGSFVSDGEVKKVVDYIQDEGPVKGGSINSNIDLNRTSGGSGGAAGYQERDEYFAEAGRLVIEKEKASIGMLQRAFKLGFNRAARIVDQLATAGVVGEEEGTKPRRVLMKMEEFEEYLKTLE